MLTRFAESGLSQTDFCKREGLNAGKFARWKREIRLRDEQSRKTKNVTDKQITEIHWRRLIAKFNRSGLSKDAFCEQEGLKPQAFVWWRGEINRRDSKKQQDFAKPLAAATEKFVPLKVIPVEGIVNLPSQESPADDEVREVLRSVRRTPVAELCFGEASIRIWRGTDQDTLRMLVQILKENKLC